MCIGLGAIDGERWLAVLIGILGVLIMIPAKYVHKKISSKVKKELAPEILRLSDEIMTK
jgi:hypothetical protein